MSKVSQEELIKSMEYLDQIEKGLIEKGAEGMDFSEATNGGKEEQIKKLKGEFNDHINKAKEAKAKLDELEKEEKVEKSEGAEEEKEEKDKPEEKEEKPSEKKEEKPDFDKEEIIKSVRDSLFGEFSEILKAKDDQINQMSERLEQISNEPIKKSFTGSTLNYKDRFEKSKSEGKTPLIKSQQKSTISNYMYQLFVETQDDILKGEIGDAITVLESSGELNPRIKSMIETKYGLDIM